MGILADRPPESTAAENAPTPEFGTKVHQSLVPGRQSWPLRDYTVAVLAALVAVLIRALLDPWLGNDHVFVLSLFCVVFVAWNFGFKPALLAWAVSMAGFDYFFVEPRHSFRIARTSDGIAVGLFFLCGIFCSILGDVQLRAKWKLTEALRDSEHRRIELEREIRFRTQVEASLNLREGQLVDANRRYADAQVQTAEALALLDTFFRNAPIGLAFIDLEMRILRLNEYLARANQASVESHIGRPLLEALPMFQGDAAEAYGVVLRTGEAVTEQIVRLHVTDRSDSIWSISLYPVLREGRQLMGIGAVCEDVTERKLFEESLERQVAERTQALRDEIDERRRAEELLRVASKELARSNEELEKFAYIASHDLQEPLRKIQAFGDRLRSKYKGALDDTGQEYVERMMSSATRMRQLINDLLSFSRVSTKGIAFEPVNLAVVVRDVLSDLEVRIMQTAANVEVGELPTLDGDPLQMRQLFQNLLGNALKFHRPGEPPRIRISSEPESQPMPDGTPRQWHRITIADEGIGFDEKYVERIFEVFQRLHGRDEYEGTGVGLAICRKIVERHSGTITATSAKGEGSTFTVLLPADQPQAEFIPYADPE